MTDTDALAPGLEIPSHLLDLSVHNGVITVSNPATGNHRALRIYTVLKGRYAGSRRIALLTGPSNESDFQTIAFQSVDGPRAGQWTVYPDMRGQDGKRSVHEILVDMLVRPGHWREKGAVYQASGTCRRCNRPLTVPASLTSGVGPVCAGK